MVGGDLVAGVTALDDVGVLAVLVDVAQAELLTGLEVVTLCVDGTDVGHGELVAVGGRRCVSIQAMVDKGQGRTYVEALLAAEMESQMSPVLTVYLRAQSVAATAVRRKCQEGDGASS